MGDEGKNTGLSTEDAVLNAALNLFYEKGVMQTTVEEIAEHAGVAKGTVYWHFNSKDDLLVALLEQHKNGILQRTSEMFGPSPDPRAVISAAARFDETWLNPEILKLRTIITAIWTMADPGILARITPIVQEIMTFHTSYMAKVFEASFGQTPDGRKRAEGAAICFIACIDGLLNRFRYFPGSSPAPEVKQAFAEIFTAMIERGKQK